MKIKNIRKRVSPWHGLTYFCAGCGRTFIHPGCPYCK